VVDRYGHPLFCCVSRAMARLPLDGLQGKPGDRPVQQHNPQETLMATITIYYKNGRVETINNVDDDATIHYENLPFSDGDVERVETKL
jgi:hypothetical protein